MNKLWLQLKENKALEIIFAGILALILLLAVYTVFFQNDKKENVVKTVTMNEKEQRLCSMLSSIEGVNAITAYINESDGEITGVVLVMDGAKNLSLRMDVTEATANALGINQKLIQIYEMK